MFLMYKTMSLYHSKPAVAPGMQIPKPSSPVTPATACLSCPHTALHTPYPSVNTHHSRTCHSLLCHCSLVPSTLPLCLSIEILLIFQDSFKCHVVQKTALHCPVWILSPAVLWPHVCLQISFPVRWVPHFLCISRTRPNALYIVGTN